MLLRLIRHPDPAVGELARQALLYVADSPYRPASPNSVPQTG
jgi:hypothetical protein